jgi:Mlc titration factor MtfA (ptsG expression regulator)
MLRWLRGGGARASEVAQLRTRIAPESWRAVLRAWPFLATLGPAEAELLHERAAWILASKTVNAAGGLALTDTMRLAIAAQAALPVLHLPTSLYEGWEEIIIYPDDFLVARSQTDEDGVVHESTEELSGEAWDGGPVVLSWSAAQAGSAGHDGQAGGQNGPADGHEGQAGGNVVIHEFAHKLDLAAGDADGVPLFLGQHAGLSRRGWERVLHRNLDRYIDMLEQVEASIPRHVDPDSPQADPWFAALPLDPYAASDEAEFFAVSAEAFFVGPQALARALPEWYDLLRRYFCQDPLAREPAA